MRDAPFSATKPSWQLSGTPSRTPFHRNSVLVRGNFSSKTTIGYQPSEDAGGKASISIKLPVVVKESGKYSRYIWNGENLRILPLENNDPERKFKNPVHKMFRSSRSAIRDFFLPKEVADNYIGYVKWKLVHRTASSALQLLATQAMFHAIGIGYSRSLPSAAALKWVLKDGLGRLTRCIYTASLASVFDTNLKMVRFTTSVLFSLSIGVELLTPIFPQHFLFLATLANTAKQISLACYLATSAAVHRSFALADNISEVSAKAQIQNVCFDNLGLLVAAILNFLSRKNPRFPFLVFPFFTALDIYGIYQSLRHVHLQTLTKARSHIEYMD